MEAQAVLWLSTHMWGSGGGHPSILNLGAASRGAVTFMTQRLYCWGMIPGIEVCMGPRG